MAVGGSGWWATLMARGRAGNLSWRGEILIFPSDLDVVGAVVIGEGEEVLALERNASMLGLGLALQEVEEALALGRSPPTLGLGLALQEGEGLVSASRNLLDQGLLEGDPNEGWGTGPVGMPPQPVHTFPVLWWSVTLPLGL